MSIFVLLPLILAGLIGIWGCIALAVSPYAPSRVPPPLKRRPRGKSGTMPYMSDSRPVQYDYAGSPIEGHQPPRHPPQGGSVIASPRPTLEETSARLRMITLMVESGKFSPEKGARFSEAALLHANGKVAHMEDALSFGEDVLASLPPAEKEPDNPFALDQRLLGIPEPRLDIRLIGHGSGKTLADCPCHACRKWRVELLAAGKITVQEAYPERVFPRQEQAHEMPMECEALQYDD